MVTALASKLGVSTAKLQAAMQATRPTSGSGAQGASADRATALAKQLGLSTAKVQAALDAVRPSGGPPQGATPQAGSAAPSSSSSSSAGTA
jgi:UDP-N-acetylmuramyl pentapeptide synthase